MEAKRRIGRPKKAISKINFVTVGFSGKMLNENCESVMKVIDSDDFKEYFRKLVLEKKQALSKDLANEILFFPAMASTLSKVALKRRGPRPKWALSIFVTQVRQKLQRAEVVLPQWKKGAKSSGLNSQSTRLLDFCKALVVATSSARMHLSIRTVSNAKKSGFSDGSF